MGVFRKILCPVDTSVFSQRALRYAVALGRRHDAEVVVLSVRPAAPPPELWLARTTAVQAENDVERAAAVEAIRTFVERAAGPSSADVRLVDGAVVPEILRAAQQMPADLIVIGTHGLGGFDRLMLGSVAGKVLRKAECAVLTIPRLAAGGIEPSETAFGTILCGMDRSAASKRALEYALSLARESGGRLVIVHVLEDFSDEEPQFARHFNSVECWRAAEPEIRAAYEALVPDDARRGCEVEVKVPRGKAYRELLAAAAESDAGLIVVGTTGWNAPLGATTERVLRDAWCPVLAVPSAGPGAQAG